MRSSALALATLLFALAAIPAAAKPSYGTAVDNKCTQNGWVPARPYNPNNLLTTDPKKVNCGLCHSNALNPGKSMNAAGQIYKSSGRTDVSPFCQPAVATNHAPTFTAIGAQMATVEQALSLSVRAADADGDAIALSISNAPAGATFTDQGGGRGAFSWTPGAGQTGNHNVTFHATDAGTPMASAAMDVTITVGAMTNRPPVLAAIGDHSIDPGMTLSLTFNASDPDGDSLTIAMQPLPSGATLTGGSFSWTPTAGQVGSHPVTVTATDSGSPAAIDSEAFVITVGQVNHPPQLSPIGNRTVDLGTTGRIPLVATDADQDMLALACSGLPSDATLTDLGDGTGEIVWMPIATGSFSVTCSVTDNALPQGSAQETFLFAARDPAPPAGAPQVTSAEWHADRAHGLLRVHGVAGEMDGDAGGRVDVFAVMTGGAAVKLGRAHANGDGEFGASLLPFIAPCQVAAAANGVMGAAVPVTDAPADCDATTLMIVRAKTACDGYSVRVKGRRAPRDATITGVDPVSGDVLFTLDTHRAGAFHAKGATSAFLQTLELRVSAAGTTWTMAVPVKPCD